ncbi:hypothetical protein [Curtanaerobium respiraculi]|uniref:hypothetical protein n=1 Tax=Curtanaerobium respiraculi TaxID=2949669 RepID=UPI0024B383D1|nr:hypothetical protein [Curtanaerobium respiraculi]
MRAQMRRLAAAAAALAVAAAFLAILPAIPPEGHRSASDPIAAENAASSQGAIGQHGMRREAGALDGVGDDAIQRLFEAAGGVRVDGGEVSAPFAAELLDPSLFEPSLVASANGVVGIVCPLDGDAVMRRAADLLRERGWTPVSSSVSHEVRCAAFSKREGRYRWVTLLCQPVLGETSLVVIAEEG